MGVTKLTVTLLALFEIAVASETFEMEVDWKVLECLMSETPSADSPLVCQEKDRIHGSLDLEGFIKDLNNVGKFVRIAYNGIGAAGPEFQDLQNKVQALGFDISELCDNSAVTVSKFKSTTRTILYELKAAFEHLLHNQEGLALVSFSQLTELAEKMEVAAEKLEMEFKFQEKKVRDLLEHTKLRGSREGIRIKEIKEQQERDRINLERQEQLMREHAKLEAEFKAERLEAEREDKAMMSKPGLLGRLGNMITSYYGLGKLFSDGSDAAVKADRYRQRTIKKLENENEQRNLKQAAYQSMAELSYNIKKAEGKDNSAIIAVEVIGKVSWSMKQLIVFLRQASLFWNGLKEHCQEIAAGEKIENFVADIAEKERRIYWSSKRFKWRMIQYMWKCVQLHNACSTHLEQIRHTQKDLYMYMREDPTYEESRKKLKELVEDFEKDLDSAYERISQQKFKSAQEIEELRKEETTELKDEL